MKILIVSHNPISTFNNMGKTLGSLFSAFPRESLCQLYLHPSVPDTEACHAYYRITDRAVLMSYLKLRVVGERVLPDTSRHALSDDSRSGQLYRKVKKVTPQKKLARNLMWKLSRWYNKDLKSWIEKEAPTHLFVAPGMPKMLYDIAFKLSKKHGLPIVTYICDDNYFLKKTRNPLTQCLNHAVRRKIERLMAASSHVVFICDPLRDAYVSRFGVQASTLMTGTSRPVEVPASLDFRVVALTYMGNLSCRREKSLLDIGHALDAINAERQTDYRLDIYTDISKPGVADLFSDVTSIRLHGFVSGDELERAVRESDCFVHVEGFDQEACDAVKFSISTKIADALGSGKPFFAYAPPEVASMQYLTVHNAACTATDPNALKTELERMLDDESYRTERMSRALQLARLNHDAKTNSRKLFELFESI